MNQTSPPTAPSVKAPAFRRGVFSRLRPQRSVLPGFRLSLGFSIAWLTLIVLIPLATIILKTLGMGWDEFVRVGLSPRALAAYRLSFGTALAAAVVNAFAGLLVAWVLVRYSFPGKRIVGAAVDLPFALPTAVAGIALTSLYAPGGWLGQWLEPHGIKVVYTATGITIALVFIGLPFVVRQVEPVLADLGKDVEEAAATLGASRAETFARVILPAIFPALLTGFALAFARGVGEYGSVIFISGNMPGLTEIAPLLIVTQLEEYNYAGATAIATIMMVVSFGILLLINLLQAVTRGREA